ncbi:phosphoribosylamine--glycine ligase [Rhodospirillum centenum]|uniref:Phosphoribosylamine--glycine ligase n=1 Tax=Rhodospirillum centenum (strain ATCC 51521 / SW) TaxID=414684 RepID=B6IXC9_RHOCS|nr:phosphoribosylamine--glycine ligase [Rhodospirillum centenum]ACJ00953.1 phosphoribosylamine--glycine ligase [Rhodospirillum centenum SW]
MKVLVVGSGGREHALCWAIAASPLCDRLWCAPGNAGIAQAAECVPVAADDVAGLVAFARANGVDFVVVGPEQPLVAGLVDRLTEVGIKAFGPSQAAAEIEGSKGFMKDLCARHGIPTAAYGRFRDAAAAKAFVRRTGAPIVVKADGLAAGKGVVICQTVAEAEAAVDDVLVGGRFGTAGAELVIEEFLDGEEASFFALCDGTTALPLAGAQDHKRAFDGDRGPNTGGMGAYSPAPVLTPELERRIMAEIVEPAVRGMAAEGRPFTGVLFAGIMVVPGPDGQPVPKLLEFNARFGDPECQVICRRLASDLLPALVAAADGQLDHVSLRWREEVALCVVMAAEGYPGDYVKGTEIRGLDRAAEIEDAVVFHAGTARAADGRVLATGGRVLGVTASARTIIDAQRQAYAAVDLIDWPEGFCRRDIGWRALERT